MPAATLQGMPCSVSAALTRAMKPTAWRSECTVRMIRRAANTAGQPSRAASAAATTAVSPSTSRTVATGSTPSGRRPSGTRQNAQGVGSRTGAMPASRRDRSRVGWGSGAGTEDSREGAG